MTELIIGLAVGLVGGAYGWPKIKKLYNKFRTGFESV
jgi:hypothetical protein